MELITDFVRVLSVASVVLAALWLLVPKGHSAQMFKYAMGIFMVALIVSTLNIALSDPPSELPAADISKVTDNAERLTDSTAEYVIERLLTSCNIKFKEVTVITDNSAESDINITKAYIKLQNSDDFERAAEIIKNQTGIITVEREG